MISGRWQEVSRRYLGGGRWQAFEEQATARLQLSRLRKIPEFCSTHVGKNWKIYLAQTSPIVELLEVVWHIRFR